MTERTDKNKGALTSEEVISPAAHDSGNTWTAFRNNASNAWYVNLNNGNVNNNNTYNRYNVLGCVPSDLILSDLWIDAERECFKNKHHSISANRLHYLPKALIDYAFNVEHNGYEAGTSITFVLNYPVDREVFAADYNDRLVHHIVAPYLIRLTEAIHNDNGNVSHGNRNNHSAHTAALQILGNFAKHRNGYVAKVDVQGFFMSIDRDKAWRMLLQYAERYNIMPTDMERTLLDRLIHHDPTKNCERHSPLSAWDRVAARKSLFCAKAGRGLPIGNFYSQLVANMFLAYVDEALRGYDVTRFVDDICIVADDVKTIKEVTRIIEGRLAEIGLHSNPMKRYIQPVKRGVSFCGRIIKQGRIYIGNRTVRALVGELQKYEQSITIENADNVRKTINSYFGLMSHCASWKIQKRIAQRVLDNFGQFLYFKKKHGQLVCLWREEYNRNKLICESLKSYKYEVR